MFDVTIEGIKKSCSCRLNFEWHRGSETDQWSLDVKQGLVNVPIVGDLFHITFKYLKDMISPIVG